MTVRESSAGVMPPHNLDAEAAVLAAVLIDGNLMHELDWLTAEHFYAESHRRIFAAAESLVNASRPVDALQVAAELKSSSRLDQAGGMAYLTDILNASPHIANVGAHAKLVRDAWRLRELIRTAQRIAAEGYVPGADADALLAGAEASVHALSDHGGGAKALEPIGAPVRRAFERIRAFATKVGNVTGTATGFERYDRVTSGLHPGEVTIVAARPGQGKTALIGNLCTSVARSGLGVAVFSMEMPSEQIAMRILCSDSRFDVRKARTGAFEPVEWTQLAKLSAEVVGWKHFLIDETPGLSLGKVRSRVRRAQSECARLGKPLRVVALDYLQLMRGNSASREQEIGDISRGLKEMAKECQVAVVALSQLNRKVEERTDKRPMLSDLRESGAIEQDADVVTFIYRDEYYNKDTKETGIAELIVAKHRNGPTGTVRVGFEAASTTFYDLPDGSYEGDER